MATPTASASAPTWTFPSPEATCLICASPKADIPIHPYIAVTACLVAAIVAIAALAHWLGARAARGDAMRRLARRHLRAVNEGNGARIG